MLMEVGILTPYNFRTCVTAVRRKVCQMPYLFFDYYVVRCRLEGDGNDVDDVFFFLHDNGFGPLAFLVCRYR
jgi:hypothetical protein